MGKRAIGRRRWGVEVHQSDSGGDSTLRDEITLDMTKFLLDRSGGAGVEENQMKKYQSARPAGLDENFASPCLGLARGL